MRELRHGSVVLLVERLSYYVVIVVGDISHAVLAGSDGDTERIDLLDTVASDAHVVRKGYFLPDAVRFLPDSNPEL